MPPLGPAKKGNNPGGNLRELSDGVVSDVT
jgi:hypothetical protein